MSLIDHWISPAGFLLDEDQHVFYSKTHPWQLNLGYFALYDKAAPLAGCILNCEPIRFTYDDRNWNIELWKGQYGGFFGAEIGIYTGQFKVNNAPTLTHYANRLGSRGDTQCAAEADWLEMSFELKHKDGRSLFKRNSDNPGTARIEKHWWLTGFKLGLIPASQLINEIRIVFKDNDMLKAFVGALLNLGYTSPAVFQMDPATFQIDPATNSVIMVYGTPKTQPQPASWALAAYDTIYSAVSTFITRVFAGVDYSIEEVGDFILTNYHLSSELLAKLLKNLNFGFTEIAVYLKDSLGLGLRAIGNALKNAGATAKQLGTALKSCGFALLDIAAFIVDKFALTNNELGKLLRYLGYSIDDIVTYFKGAGTDYNEVMKILKSANYAKDTILHAISRGFNRTIFFFLTVWNSIV